MNVQGHNESRTETMSVKITPSMKAQLDELPECLKHKLIAKIIKEIDFAIYISKYRPPAID